VRGRLGRPSEAEQALVPRLTGQPIGLLASIARAFSRRLDGSAVNAFARFDGHGERIKARRATGRRSTEANVKSFKPPAGKVDHIEFEETMPGFGLRVRGGKARYYVAQYRVGRRSDRTTLGNASKVTLADAKAHAKRCSI
jgi:hypothetical protein